MSNATPAYLDPALGVTLPRPPGLGVGDYPQQDHAAVLAWWLIGASNQAIRQPFGDAVSAPLHLEYDLCFTSMLAIRCLGDPDQPDDRSVVQIAQDNPPQVGRVFTTWFWCDWLRNTQSLSAAFNRTLVGKTANAYLGVQVRNGEARPCLGVGGMGANGGTALAALTNITIAAPGNATVAALDAPLIAEDGSASAPQPLAVPCWVGRWGFRGAVGQVLAGGSTNQNLGYFLKVKPVTFTLAEDIPGRRIAVTAGTPEFGCEVYGACAYSMALFDAAVTYLDTDFSQPGPPWPCRTYGVRCWKSREQMASIQIFLTPLGDAWQAIVAISQLQMSRSAGGGRYVFYSNFTPGFYTEKNAGQQTTPPVDVTATPIGCGTTTTINRPLFAGEATLAVQVVVSATGQVTACEARIVRNVTVTNLGSGWHDTFAKL